MKKAPKVLSMLLSLLLAAAVVCAAPLTVCAEDQAEPNPYHASGDCGATENDNVQYYVFHDGSIAFFGSGAIKNCPPNSDKTPSAPWYNEALFQSLTSTKISVEDGVTAIGDYAFYIPTAYSTFVQTNNIELPNSLTKIGAHAFENQSRVEKITIPQNVTYIGNGAFNGCKKLTHIDIYADPDDIKYWGDSEPFTQQVTCHLKPEYAGKIQELTNLYSEKKHIKFEANLYYENNMDEEGVKRNIKGSFGQEHSAVLGNALPFLVVGTFSGAKKSVTYGNNGFASCVKIGNEYYVHTNNNSRNIQKATVNDTSGVVTYVDINEHPTLKLETSRDYIGSNIVRLKYTLKNEGETAINDVMLGGTGDIKIGADDYAAIKPMYENGDNTKPQIGFYMTSTKSYDKDENEKYATLGFIGKGVEIESGKKSDDATFFYGATAANKATSATGAFRHRLMPERIFSKNDNSIENGGFNQGTDSGMSYFWNIGEIAAGETKEYAVMFSVYGEEKDAAGNGMIEELSQKYYTVTWKNEDNSVLEKQLVKAGETPAYTETPPEKAHDNKFDYEFSGWSPTIVACTEDTTYTAQFNAVPRKLFAGHSLTLGGDIGVKFYLDVPVADVAVDDVKKGAKKFTVQFDWFNKHSEYRLEAADYDEKSGCFIAKCNVAAAEMAYNIHAEVYIDNEKYKSNNTAVKDYDDYSVRDYGLHIINHPYDFSLPLVDLAKKMLDYGAKAQVVFNRIPNSPANEGVKYQMAEYKIPDDYPDMENGLEGSGLEYYNTSLLFNSKTGLRQYYRVRNQAQFDNLSNRSAFKQNGTLYYLEVEEIPAFELADKHTFTVGAHSYNYSALDYAMLLQEVGDADQKNLGTALYWYYAAAKTYFTPLQEAE